MAIELDKKTGSRVTKDRNGYRAERIAYIITDTPASITAEAALSNAINDALIPALGTVHPTISTIYLSSIECEPLAKGKYRITMSYTDEPGYPGVLNDGKQASATLARKSVRQDWLTGPLKVDYQTTADQANDPVTTTTEYFTAAMEKPRAEFEFTYTASSFPQTIINTYLGRTNLDIWNGYAVETVLCTAVNAVKMGDEYSISISFAYDPDGWQFTAVAAVPPSQIQSSTTTGFSTATGEKTFTLYTPVGFAALNLTL